VVSTSVARRIPFFTVRLLDLSFIYSHGRVEVQRINGFGSMFG
jgi:hypothetical protein